MCEYMLKKYLVLFYYFFIELVSITSHFEIFEGCFSSLMGVEEKKQSPGVSL